MVEWPLLSISKICACFLTLLNIVYIMCSFLFGEIYPLPKEIVLPILCICLIATVISTIQQTHKFDSELLEKLNSLDEDSLINIYSCLDQRKSLLKDEGIFFIENFNKLNKLCRSYVIAYLRHKLYKKQIWCVFDYLFEDSLKIDSVEETVFYESFKLVPLNYEEKEALYKEYNLQRDIKKEYLNCIGVDILWGSRADIDNGSFKFHSLDYIRERIESIRKEFDPSGRLTRIFYCLVYMSSKYKYSFSVNQIISLVQNEENVNQHLRAIICDAGSRVLGSDIKSKEEIRGFISKITNLLEEYCFIEYKREGGRKVKKYKFSYDILECFQKKMNSFYPDEETVKRWVFVKLISNKDMFWMERYFFDCSNLLVKSDFLEDNEFCILSSYLLRIMNANNCWIYTCPILRRLRYIEENIRKQYLQEEAVKRAAGNCMFYSSDNESLQYGIYFLAGIEGCSVDVDDFSLDSCTRWMPEMEKYSSVLSGYFKLLYKTFGSVILDSFEIGKIYQDVDVEPFAEQDKLFEIIRKSLLCCISCLNKISSREIFNENSDWIVRQLPQIRMCAEANEFTCIVEEMLLWVKSELDGEQDRVQRNIYTGMLVETSGSNMLYFIYGLLNMAFVKDREMIYKNKNSILDFISQSVFYFEVITQAKGITRYVDELLQGRQSIDLKLNIAIELLIKDNPCREILRSFIIENMDRAKILFLSCLKYQKNTEQIEKYIALLLLYNTNMDSMEFTEKVLGQVSDHITSSECVDGDRIGKYLRVILEKECTEEEMMDIVDEINQIESPDFAVWVLYGYCEIKEEMLERIPQIKLNILTKCTSNLDRIMLSHYLLKHSYYDCNREILELYLQIMRNNKFPNEGDIISYLNIIDKYARDNENIKYDEMGTYNYLLSLYLYYSAVKLSEHKEVNGILLQGTMKFMLRLITSLEMVGIKILAGNGTFSSLLEENGRLTRKQETDKLIIKRFFSSKPIISMGGEMYLLEDYCYMILYMNFFPDVCIPLIEQAEKNCMEIIKQKHMLYLLNVLLESTKSKALGFDRRSLYRVRDILRERYNIQY